MEILTIPNKNLERKNRMHPEKLKERNMILSQTVL